MLKTFEDSICPTKSKVVTFGQNSSKMQMAKNSVVTFGERLRTLREEAKLSLREVASEMGIDTSLLAKIERNIFAYRIIEEEADLDTLKVAEKKVEYLKKQK
jgi:ribosome-binding protein aMBF1 (putative translation factor)